MEKNNLHRKKKFVPGAFKFMVAVGSLAGTVGIWNTLANKDLLQASAQNLDLATTAGYDQPLPTVVPLLQVGTAALPGVTAQSTTTVRDVTVNTSPQSSAPALTGGSSTTTTINPPAPITTTNSSRRP